MPDQIRTSLPTESLLQAVIDSSLDAIMVLNAIRDGSGDIVDFEWQFANAAAEAISGIAQEQLVGSRLLEVMPGAREEGLFDAYCQVVESGEAYRREDLYPHDGYDVWYKLKAVKVGDGVCLTIENTTEKERAKSQAESLLEEASFVSENLPVGLVWLNDKREVVEVNQRTLELMQITREEALSGKWRDRLHPENLEAYLKTRQEAMDTGQPYQYEITVVLEDGSLRNLLVDGKPFQTKSGERNYMLSVTDITDLKAAQQAVQENESRLKRITSSVPAIIFESDEKGMNTFVSFHSNDVIGQSPESTLGDGWTDAVHPEDREAVYQAWLESVREWKPYEASGRTIAPDGSIRYVYAKAVPYESDDGKRGFTGTVTDITELKRTQEELEENEKRLRRIAANIPAVIFETDQHGYHTFVSEQARMLGGLEPEAVLGDGWLNSIHPDDREEVWSKWRQAIDSGSPFEEEARTLLPDGSVRHIFCRAMPYQLEDGTRGYTGFVTDLSDLKRAQEAALENQTHLQTLLDNTVDAVITTDLDCNIESFNPAAERIFGWKAEEILGRNVTLVMPATFAREHDGYVKRYLTTGEKRIIGIGREVTALHRDGHEFPVHLSVADYEHAGKRRFLALVRDFTQQKALEQTAFQAQKVEAIGNLAGGVAHDFNNILGAIVGYSGLGVAKAPEDSKLLSYFRQIQTAATRAADLTRQLLAFSRADTTQPESLNLAESLEGWAKMLGRLLTNNVTLVYELADDLWPVLIDPVRAEQIIINLVLNARDAMDSGGRIVLSIQKSVLSEVTSLDTGKVPAGEYVEIVVEDNGKGMNPAVLERVYEPFFTTKSDAQASGMGLATVYGIVKDANGGMAISSTEGEGTRVRILLPRHLFIGRTKVIDTDRTASFEPKNILVVDDDPAMLDVVNEVLGDHGFPVSTCDDPTKVIDRMKELEVPVDLLLTDIVMPNLNGLDLAEQVAQQHPEVKILYMTGYAPPYLQERLSRIEGKKILRKPFTNEALLRRIRRATKDTGDHTTTQVV